MGDFGNSSALLPALSGLSQLHTLLVTCPDWGPYEGLGAVVQLTGLRELHLHDRRATAGLLLQLTALRGLTQLKCYIELDVVGQFDLCWHLATKVGQVAVWSA